MVGNEMSHPGNCSYFPEYQRNNSPRKCLGFERLACSGPNLVPANHTQAKAINTASEKFCWLALSGFSSQQLTVKASPLDLFPPKYSTQNVHSHFWKDKTFCR